MYRQMTFNQKLEQFLHDSDDEDPTDPNQKLLINFTIFPNTEDIEDVEDELSKRIEYYSTEYVKQIRDKLKYKILKLTIGIHRQATRPHIHMFVNFRTHKGKKYQYLAQKIAKTATPFDIVDDIKQTIVYEGEPLKQKKKIIKYDETSMRYCFKEGNLDDYYWGITDDEYTTLRAKAIEEWNTVLKMRKAEEEKTKTKNENKKHLYEHTYDEYKIQHSHLDTIKEKIKKVIRIMLQYHREEMLNLDVTRLKNKAIEFLYYYEFIDEEEIIQYIYI